MTDVHPFQRLPPRKSLLPPGVDTGIDDRYQARWAIFQQTNNINTHNYTPATDATVDTSKPAGFVPYTELGKAETNLVADDYTAPGVPVALAAEATGELTPIMARFVAADERRMEVEHTVLATQRQAMVVPGLASLYQQPHGQAPGVAGTPHWLAPIPIAPATSPVTSGMHAAGAVAGADVSPAAPVVPNTALAVLLIMGVLLCVGALVTG